ncbi:MAG: hypothetical protein ACI4E0_02275, partial [Blautia sp.]
MTLYSREFIIVKEEKRAEQEGKTEKIRIQVEIEKSLKWLEIYEKNRQDIKTPRKRLFVRIFWKIPAKKASKSLVNQGFLTGWGENDVELERALTQAFVFVP